MAIRHQYGATAGIIGAYGAGQAERRLANRDYGRAVLLQQQRHAQRMQELGYVDALRGGRGGRRRGAPGTGTIGGRWIDPLAVGGTGALDDATGGVLPGAVETPSLSPTASAWGPMSPATGGTAGMMSVGASAPGEVDAETALYMPGGATKRMRPDGSTYVVPGGRPADSGATPASYYSTPRPIEPGPGGASERATSPHPGTRNYYSTPRPLPQLPGVPGPATYPGIPGVTGILPRGPTEEEAATAEEARRRLYESPDAVANRAAREKELERRRLGVQQNRMGGTPTSLLAPGTGIPGGGYASPAQAREQELAQRRLRVQQNAQMRQAERTQRMGGTPSGDLLPYYEPPVSLEQQRFDLQRQRFGFDQQREQQRIKESQVGRESRAEESALGRKMTVYGERVEEIQTELGEIGELGGGGQWFTDTFKPTWDAAQKDLQGIYRDKTVDKEDPVQIYEAIANSSAIQEALQFDPLTDVIPFSKRPGAVETRHGIKYQNSLDGTGEQTAIDVDNAEEFMDRMGYKGDRKRAYVDISSGRPKIVERKEEDDPAKTQEKLLERVNEIRERMDNAKMLKTDDEVNPAPYDPTTIEEALQEMAKEDAAIRGYQSPEQPEGPLPPAAAPPPPPEEAPRGGGFTTAPPPSLEGDYGLGQDFVPGDAPPYEQEPEVAPATPPPPRPESPPAPSPVPVAPPPPPGVAPSPPSPPPYETAPLPPRTPEARQERIKSLQDEMESISNKYSEGQEPSIEDAKKFLRLRGELSGLAGG